jgi:sec-independent protein translocase protein TatA
MGIPGPTELILILAVVLLIFGAKRIPEIMGGVGQGIKSLKKSLEQEDEPVKPVQTQSTAIPSPGGKPVEPS